MNPAMCHPNIITLDDSSDFASSFYTGRHAASHQVYRANPVHCQTSVRLDPRGIVKKPKKNLTAYNLFYALERKRILAGVDHLDLPIEVDDLLRIRSEHKTSGKRSHKKKHGLIGFHELNRIIIKRWKGLPSTKKSIFQQQAQEEKEEYAVRLELWEQQERANCGISSFVISAPDISKPPQTMHATVSTDSLASHASSDTSSSSSLSPVPKKWLEPLMFDFTTPDDLCKPLDGHDMKILFDDIDFECTF